MNLARWSVEVWLPMTGWTPLRQAIAAASVIPECVDRPTADRQKLDVKRQGYDARIVRAPAPSTQT